MTVTLNGETVTTAAATLGDLVTDRLGQLPKGSAVAVNEEVVRRSELASHSLQDGDRVEVLTAVAGG